MKKKELRELTHESIQWVRKTDFKKETERRDSLIENLVFILRGISIPLDNDDPTIRGVLAVLRSHNLTALSGLKKYKEFKDDVSTK